MEKLLIDLGADSYEIHIGADILANLKEHVGQADKWVIITDENVKQFYSDKILASLENQKVQIISISPGEESKNFRTIESILNQMLALGLTRKSKVIALGGGVVGDIAGFCASIYMRGIPFIQIPTTLLAQVDSSVGGKTGINLAHGKNSAGSFYQPEAVVIDISTLQTLPKRELISGLAEVIKYGIIYDYNFLQYLTRQFHIVLDLDENVVTEVVEKCCRIKAEVVVADEKEKGLRKILNHGHTIGHGLEIVTEYGEYTHGEAVLIGMYYEAKLAKELEMIDQDYFQEIVTLLEKTRFPLQISKDLLLKLPSGMLKDKKNIDQQISFVLPCAKGEVTEVLLTEEEVIDNITKILEG